MAGKRNRRLDSALVSAGVVALIAGCGGGGATSNGHGGVTYVPPASGQKATATLSLTVPGRRPASSTRNPRYVSPYTSTIQVAAVPNGAPSPWPIATATTVPTPGPLPSGATPSPIPITMTVQVPVGNDQFAINSYDSSGYLLSGITTASVPILVNTNNQLSFKLNPAAGCVAINGVNGSSFKMTPLENQTAAQTANFTVQACDVDGYPIPAGETLANAIIFATPAPTQITVNQRQRHPLVAMGTPAPTPTPVVSPTAGPALSFSPNAIIYGGATTVTVSYPAQASGATTVQAVPSPLPTGAGMSAFPQIIADPVYYVFVDENNGGSSDGKIDVAVHDVMNTMSLSLFPTIPLGTGTGLYTGPIAGAGPMGGCANAGQVVVPASGYLNSLSIPAPSTANPTPQPTLLSAVSYGGRNPNAVALDASCTTYVGDSNGYLWSGGLQLGGPFSVGPAIGTITSVGVMSGMAYVGLANSGAYTSSIQNQNGVAQDNGGGTSYTYNTQAMAQINASDFAVAYKPASQSFTGATGDLRLGLWRPAWQQLMSSVDVGASSAYENAKSIAADPSGNIWVLTDYPRLIEWTASGALTFYGLGCCNYNGMAIAPDGMMFLTNSYYGWLEMYDSARPGATVPAQGGSVAAQLQARVTLSTTGASGVVVVP